MKATEIFPKVIQPNMEMSAREWLQNARATARRLCLVQSECTIDDVRGFCPPPDHVDPRVMGAVFSTDEFEHTGKFIRSKRKRCHGRPIGVFRLKNSCERYEV